MRKCFPAYFPEGISFEDFERDLLVKAMIKANGVRAACLLGTSYGTLQYRLNKFGIEKEAYSAPKGLSPKPKGGITGGPLSMPAAISACFFDKLFLCFTLVC